MTKLHYPHSHSTGEALAPIPADPDRLAGQDEAGNWLRYFETDYASPDAPPAAGSHEVACRLMPDGAVARDFGAGAWVIKPDWRGHKYWPADAKHGDPATEIKDIGVEPPANALDAAPPKSAADIAAEKAGQTVTMRQARLALLAAGKLTAVNQAIAAMTGTEGEAARIEWEYATTVVRGSPLVAGLAAALGLDDAALDALFTAAAAIQ